MKRQATTHDKLIVIDLFDIRLLGVEFVLDVADQFLDDVIKRDDPRGAAEFIEDKRKVCAAQRKTSSSFSNEIISGTEGSLRLIASNSGAGSSSSTIMSLM